MRAELANLNHFTVPFLSRAAVNLSWYDSTPYTSLYTTPFVIHYTTPYTTTCTTPYITLYTAP